MPACPAVSSPPLLAPPPPAAIPYRPAAAEKGQGRGRRRPAGSVQARGAASWTGICKGEERAAMRLGTVIGARQREEEVHLTPAAQQRPVRDWAPGPQSCELLRCGEAAGTSCRGPASRVRWPEHLPWHQRLRRSSRAAAGCALWPSQGTVSEVNFEFTPGAGQTAGSCVSQTPATSGRPRRSLPSRGERGEGDGRG